MRYHRDLSVRGSCHFKSISGTFACFSINSIVNAKGVDALHDTDDSDNQLAGLLMI